MISLRRGLIVFYVLFLSISTRSVDASKDGFTMMIASYKRDHYLPDLLSHLTTTPPPSLRQIVIIYQNVDSPLPPILSSESLANFSSPTLKVTVRRSVQNSMNERFRPAIDWGEEIETDAVMIHDDDIVLRKNVLEWGYQQFLIHNPPSAPREQGRIVGFTGRDFWKVDPVEEPEKAEYEWEYVLQPRETYSMILSNAAWFRKSWFERYFGEDEEMKGLREYVDEVFNCDDILINYIVSNLTHQPPLLLQPSIPLRSIPGHGLWSHPFSSPSDSDSTSSDSLPPQSSVPSPDKRKYDHFTQRWHCMSHFFSHFAPHRPSSDSSPNYPLLRTDTAVTQIVRDRTKWLQPGEAWEELDWENAVMVPGAGLDEMSKEERDELFRREHEGEFLLAEGFDTESEGMDEEIDRMTDEELEAYLRELEAEDGETDGGESASTTHDEL